jgi:hypothetical protein
MKVNTTLMLFCLAVLLTATTRASAQPDPNFHIYLCFGQSNMESGGKIEEKDRTVDKRFQVLADFDNPKRDWKKGQWYDAVPPLTRRTKGFSLVDSFGRTMVANLPEKVRVGVIKVGIAGTKIEVWDKDSYKEYLANSPAWKVKIANEYGGNPYGYFVDLAKIAQKDGVIKGILLHQGESNAEDQDWPRKVKKVYDQFITDLNLNPEAVPLLAGEVVHDDQKGEKAIANEIMKNLPATLPNSHVISSAGLPCNPDHLHFTGEGYRQFGRRYAEKMLEILGYKVKAAK